MLQLWDDGTLREGLQDEKEGQRERHDGKRAGRKGLGKSGRFK